MTHPNQSLRYIGFLMVNPLPVVRKDGRGRLYFRLCLMAFSTSLCSVLRLRASRLS
jgi:hypothetical protein